VLKALDLPLVELMQKILERMKPYKTKMVRLDTMILMATKRKTRSSLT
jgi:hypothetical protein